MAAVSDSPPVSRLTRRTRIVCISDTHNTTVKLPKGDVLIHAGDLTNKGSYSEVGTANPWAEYWLTRTDSSQRPSNGWRRPISKPR